MMRFEAKMEDPKVEDRNRRFVVTYYIADGSVGVWESKCRHGGQWEGKFASKSRKKNPVTGIWFQPSDFAVGEIAVVSGVCFRLLNADEATFAYMEENAADFPWADANVIAAKIAGVKKSLLATERISVDDLANLVQLERGIQLSPHEIITVSRAFGEKERGETTDVIDVSKLLKQL